MSMQNQTKGSFDSKWSNNKQLAFDETLREGTVVQNWILQRNGLKNLHELNGLLGSFDRILDAGCGNGRVTALLREHSKPLTEIVGIDLVAAKVAEENLKGYDNVKFYEKDLLGDLSDLGKFDFIYCQEVLHHTADPEKSFSNLVNNCLDEDGTIAIYVYKRKAPIREYADDLIRDKISDLGYEQAKVTCEKIAELGKALSELKQSIKVPSIPELGIEAGEYDVQRFIYHHFMKCFWNEEFSFDANVAINYDWYHPQLCYRYDLQDIEKWFRNSKLEITHSFADHYGITMHGKKIK